MNIAIDTWMGVCQCVNQPNKINLMGQLMHRHAIIIIVKILLLAVIDGSIDDPSLGQL